MSSKHPRRILAITAALWTVTWLALGSLSDWGAYWASWLLAGFLVPELYALLVNPGWTLSWTTWRFERLDIGHPFAFAEWTPIHWAVAVIVWGLAIWLSGHLPFGEWR